VPFLIRAGKCLPATATEVVVELRRPRRIVFEEPDAGDPNALRFMLSPNVALALRPRAKVPGERMVGEDVELVARDHHPDEMPPYERLLGDAMRGDPAAHAPGAGPVKPNAYTRGGSRKSRPRPDDKRRTLGDDPPREHRVE
jgi:glucose-6-phosphate 1-dehydrogenase